MRVSVVLLLILFAGSSALSARAYVLYERAGLTIANVAGASSSLLTGLPNAETGQRGYFLTGNPVYLQPHDAALSTVPAGQRRIGSEVSRDPS